MKLPNSYLIFLLRTGELQTPDFPSQASDLCGTYASQIPAAYENFQEQEWPRVACITFEGEQTALIGLTYIHYSDEWVYAR